MPTADILTHVKATGAISAEDALAVRRAVYGDDGAINAGEIEEMLRTDEAAAEADLTWTQLVGEAGADFLVHQQPPQGYISEANADWLADRIVRDGLVKTPRQFELLVHALEQATSAPENLSALALRQVQHAVIDGNGPLAGTAARGCIGSEEVALLRRILYAFGGEGGVAITRSEAEVLFDLNDAASAGGNDPSWDDLFVKAIANSMMAASGYVAPSRDVALKHEAWLDDPIGGVGSFIGKMAAGGLRGILAAYKSGSDDGWAERSAAKIDEMTRAEVVTEGEAGWLAERIGRDGVLNPNEKALLRFIREEAPTIHPSLAALIDKAA